MEINNSILTSAKKILHEYNLCAECFGRQFALLGTGLSNTERAHSIFNILLLEYCKQMNESQGSEGIFTQNLEFIRKIATNTDYEPANLVMKKYDATWENSSEFTCYLCNNVFSNLDTLVDEIQGIAKEYEFSNYLVGTSANAKILDREDEFRARLEINSGESLKRNINRETGKKLEDIWKKSVEFGNPELIIKIQLDRDKHAVHISSNPLCIKGRYRKFLRGIPQTHWPH
ncbi:MAG: hypothetical protein ACTSRD_03200, partial [Promethearchaeota archaeon]